MEVLAGSMTFIVRMTRDGRGLLRGVVERVRTGEKERVDGIEAVSPLVARMLARGGNDDASATGCGSETGATRPPTAQGDSDE